MNICFYDFCHPKFWNISLQLHNVKPQNEWFGNYFQMKTFPHFWQPNFKNYKETVLLTTYSKIHFYQCDWESFVFFKLKLHLVLAILMMTFQLLELDDIISLSFNIFIYLSLPMRERKKKQWKIPFESKINLKLIHKLVTNLIMNWATATNSPQAIIDRRNVDMC